VPRPPEQHALLRALGHILTRERTIRGISQRQVEERTGISEQYIRRLEAGSANPSYLALIAICGAIEADPLAVLRSAHEGLTLPTRFHPDE
jgi:transcriptional regulator with XRE-family HTH domain